MAFDLESLSEATSGAIGALVSTTISYPLDTCKTKYQAEVRAHHQQKYRYVLSRLVFSFLVSAIVCLQFLVLWGAMRISCPAPGINHPHNLFYFFMHSFQDCLELISLCVVLTIIFLDVMLANFLFGCKFAIFVDEILHVTGWYLFYYRHLTSRLWKSFWSIAMGKTIKRLPG